MNISLFKSHKFSMSLVLLFDEKTKAHIGYKICSKSLRARIWTRQFNTRAHLFNTYSLPDYCLGFCNKH